MISSILNLSRSVTVILIVLLLGGCVTSLKVQGSYPAPLIEKLDVSAKIIFPEEFKNYTYTEKSGKRPLEAVGMGEAHVALFNRIFNSLLVLDSAPTENPELVITPQFLDFQYSVPRESTLNLFEVWIKYRLRVEGVNGEELADWVIKGYGKTPTGTFKLRGAAFNTAINVALRDVGAQISIGFIRQPSIRQYLQQRLPLEQTAQALEVDQQQGKSVDASKQSKLTEPVKQAVIPSEPKKLSNNISES